MSFAIKTPIAVQAKSDGVALAVAIASGWPVLMWYARRAWDHSDEPLGILALLAALGFWWAKRPHGPVTSARVRVAAALLAAYALSVFTAPPLLRGIFWVLAIGTLAAPRRGTASWCGLLLLSLPWMATLQFYLGFPLRWIATRVAACVLSVLVGAVVPNGTVLEWHGQQVLIDVPCAGLQMGWMMTAVALVIATAQGASWQRTFWAVRAAWALAFVTNVARIAGLFFAETHTAVSKMWLHDAIGLTLFAAAISAQLLLAARTARAT